jgi:hypothetical protein
MSVRFVSMLLAWLVLAGLDTTGLAGGAKALVGEYIVKGTNPDGSKYDGTAQITFEAGNTVKVDYRFGDRRELGLGALKGDTLTVKFQGAKNTERTGDAVYTLQDNGHLVGHWHYKGDKKMPERLIPQKK